MYYVARTTVDKCPLIDDIQGALTMEEALDKCVVLAKASGATESDADIREEILTDGYYRPSKHAEWAVQYGHLIDRE